MAIKDAISSPFTLGEQGRRKGGSGSILRNPSLSETIPKPLPFHAITPVIPTLTIVIPAPFRHFRTPFVIPAKAGIQRGGA